MNIIINKILQKKFLFLLLILYHAPLLSMEKDDYKPNRFQKILQWLKNNPKKTIFGTAFIAGYLGATPGGRQLIFDSFIGSKKFINEVVYNPKALFSLIKQKSPLSFVQAVDVGLHSLGLGMLWYFIKKITSASIYASETQTITHISPMYHELNYNIINNLPINTLLAKGFAQHGFCGTIPHEIQTLIKNIIRKENHQPHSLIPNGILLYGPTGNGKTLSVKTTAMLCGAPLVVLSNPVTPLQGSGALNIQSTFKEAQKLAQKFGHAILFIDEVETLAQKRSNKTNFSEDYAAAFSALLTYMDGIQGKGSPSNITVIAATNRKNDLDPAFIRSGRIDYMIEFKNPNKESRKAIFKQKLSNTEKQLIDYLAEQSEGLSAADCDMLAKNILSELKERKLREFEFTEQEEPSSGSDTESDYDTVFSFIDPENIKNIFETSLENIKKNNSA